MNSKKKLLARNELACSWWFHRELQINSLIPGLGHPMKHTSPRQAEVNYQSIISAAVQRCKVSCIHIHAFRFTQGRNSTNQNCININGCAPYGKINTFSIMTLRGHYLALLVHVSSHRTNPSVPFPNTLAATYPSPPTPSINLLLIQTKII